MKPIPFFLTLGLACVSISGCSPKGLAPGNPLPALEVEGWLNATSFERTRGSVLVVHVFGSW